MFINVVSLQGQNLTQGAMLRDYKVTVGGDPAEVIEVHNDRIFCHLDNEVHHTVDDLPKAVTVKVGDVGPDTVFFLYYPLVQPTPGAAVSTAQTSWLLPAVVAGGVLLLVVVVVVFVGCRRSRKKRAR